MKDYCVTGVVTFDMEAWFSAPCDITEADLMELAADALYEAPLHGLADIEIGSIEEVK